MEIIIPLPQCSSANTYQEVKSYLKQLELAVHHAQKSVEQLENEKVEITEQASFVIFEDPSKDEGTDERMIDRVELRIVIE